ncbi:MAG: exchange transporter [Alphaproteobacteria bacterium]|jgi:AAA family ATP:ADP antiporter|nr:exchange transporter [Alphaproteobacteria bacterium]MDF3033742.1 exchange transporter [Alphaproteobacteria bacterium]
MSATQITEPEFTGWRAALWPIHNHELKKFLPLALIMFCILFNYTALRDMKDTVVVSSAGAGAISFLKLYCVTPAAILFVIIYAKLTNALKRENVFYAVVTPFLVFFGAFAFIIYPNLTALHPNPESISALKLSYPSLIGFIDIYAYWAFSLFYVLAEIWGSAMIALMFWQFANHVVRMRESKRFYGLFAVVANVALIFSGQLVRFCSEDIKQYYATREEAWQMSLYLLMGSVVVLGVIAMMLYRWMHTSVLTDKRFFDPEEAGIPKKKKEKPSLMESLKLILRSPELGLIALLIMAYGVTINLIEVQWKNQLGLFYTDAAGIFDKGGYNAFMGNFSTLTGVFTILFGLVIGSNVLRRVSWFAAAVVTPLTITLGGVVFFAFIFAREWVDFILQAMATSPVAAASFLGAGIIIVSKGIKYILFDSTKEMAYIPLDDELKTKGKAAVDVIGGRAGKAGGAFVQSNLQMVLAATVATSGANIVSVTAPYAFGIFAIVCVLWLYAVKGLSKKVTAAVERRRQEMQAS